MIEQITCDIADSHLIYYTHKNCIINKKDQITRDLPSIFFSRATLSETSGKPSSRSCKSSKTYPVSATSTGTSISLFSSITSIKFRFSSSFKRQQLFFDGFNGD